MCLNQQCANAEPASRAHAPGDNGRGEGGDESSLAVSTSAGDGCTRARRFVFTLGWLGVVGADGVAVVVMPFSM